MLVSFHFLQMSFASFWQFLIYEYIYGRHVRLTLSWIHKDCAVSFRVRLRHPKLLQTFLFSFLSSRPMDDDLLKQASAAQETIEPERIDRPSVHIPYPPIDLKQVEDTGETRQAERVDRPPATEEGLRPSKVYAPLSFPVIVLLMPAAVFGVLARLGLVALMTFEGESVFPLAYAQAMGCLIMGMGLRMKEPIGQLWVWTECPLELTRWSAHSYAPLYTALTTGQILYPILAFHQFISFSLSGFCGSLTTFSSWQLDVFNAWIDAGRHKRGGLRDVSIFLNKLEDR